jgi:hypothetical protein
MDPANDADDSRALVEQSRGLVDHPQRLGVLPTWWFWTGENWRLARIPVVVAAGLLVVVFGSLGLPVVVTAIVPAAVFTLGLGVFERYIRRRALARVGSGLSVPASRGSA